MYASTLLYGDDLGKYQMKNPSAYLTEKWFFSKIVAKTIIIWCFNFSYFRQFNFELWKDES